MITDVITKRNFNERSPIAQLNRQYSSSPPFIAAGRSLTSQPGTKRALPTLLISPQATQWFLSPEARKVLTAVPDSPEPLGVATLSPLFETQLINSLEARHSDLAGGVECLSIAIATWGCYRALKDGTSVVKEVFCVVDLLMSVLELLKWLPGVKEIAENLTIVHICWSVAGKLAEPEVFTASEKEGKKIITAIASQPLTIQGVTFRV